MNFFRRHRSIIIYGTALAALLLIMRWLEWRFLVLDHATEMYGGIVALLFTGLGIWLANKLTRPKVNTVVVEKEVLVRTDEFVLNQKELARLGLTSREMEVLQSMAEGLSNQEIAERLFLSVPTIKTHTSKLFEKLEVQRRTHAVDRGRKLGIIP